MVALGAVSIPIDLGLQNFNRQINTVKTSIAGLSTPIKAFGLGVKQALFDTVLNTLKLSGAFTGLATPLKGANAGILKFGVASSAYLAATVAFITPIANVFNTLTNLGQIFAPITTNALVLQQIAARYGAGGLTFYGRYADYFRLASIIREISAIAPKGGLLNIGLDVLTRPAKLARELGALATAARLTVASITGIQTAINGIQLDILNSAGSLISGGGFLAPGQLPQGPTVLNMFDARQAIESRVGFEQLTQPLQNLQRLTGLNNQEISNFENTLLNLSLSSRQTVESLSLSSQAMLMQGKSAEESKTDLKDLAAIATGTSVNLDQLTRATLDVQQAFQDIAAKDIASSLSIVSLQTGTAVDQYATAINRLNPAIQANGQNLTDVLTVLGQLSEAGVEGEQAGFKLNNLFQSLNNLASGNASKSAQTGLADLGIKPEELTNAEGQLNSILEVSNLIRERVGAFESANGSAATQGILTSIFGNRDATAVTALLQSTTEEVNKLNNSIAGASGLSQKLSDVKSESFTAQLQKLSDSAATVSTKIGGVLVPIFQAIISPIANLVAAFAQLPPAVIAGTIAFNAALPALLLYFTGIRTYIQLTKLAALAQTVWGGILDLSTGKLTINALATKALAEAQKVAALVNTVLAGSYQLLTGQMTLATARQNIFNAVTAFGNANLKEYLSTTAAATKIMLKHALTMGLVVGVFMTFSELLRKSEGAKFAEQLRKSSSEVEKLNKSMTAAGTSANSFSVYMDRLAEVGQKSGWIEVLRTLLVDLDARLFGGANSLSEYGQEWRATAEQTGNVKAMLALDEVLTSINGSLEDGTDILVGYKNGQALTGTEAEAFKQRVTAQIEELTRYQKVLSEQKAPTKTQQDLQQANIKLLDQQISRLRGVVVELNNEGKTIKSVIIPSYDEIIKKQKEIEGLRKRNLTNQRANILESQLKGNINSANVEKQNLLEEQINIKNRQKAEADLQSQLKAAMTGETDPEKVKQAQESLNESLQNSADLRLEAAQNQLKLNDISENRTIEEATIEILNQQTEQKKAQLALEQDIANGKLKGNDIERQRNEIQLQGILAQIAANEEAQKKLSGKSGEGIAAEQKKLAEEQIDLQTQLAQAQVEQQQQANQEIVKGLESRLETEKAMTEQALAASEAQGARNNFKSQELQAQKQLTEAVAGLDNQRLQFQLELANRSQDTTKAEQTRLAIYEQQKAQLAQQQAQQQQSLELTRQQQELELERKRLSAELAILEAEANIEKAQAEGATDAELGVLSTALSIRQSQLALIDEEAASIKKVNETENQRIAIENETKAKQLEQQRILELQDLAVQKITDKLAQQQASLELKTSEIEQATQALERQGQLIQSQTALADAQANLEKQRLDFQLSLANLGGDTNKIEQAKAAIFLQQREEILRQAEAQKVSLALSKQQQTLELQRQQLQAQSALLEAQANVEKAKAQGVSGQQLATLQQSVNIQRQQLASLDQQKALNEQLQANEQQKLAIEQQTKLEQIDQQRQLELIEAKAQAIASAYERQKEQLDLSSQALDLNASRLEQQSSLLTASQGVSEAGANLEKQRLEYQLQMAEILGDEASQQQLKNQLYQQELASLAQRQSLEEKTLKITQEKQRLDLQRQKIQAEIATLEAKSNLEQAQAKGASSEELARLNRMLELRKQQQSFLLEEQANAERIQALEQQKLNLEQQGAREQLTQSKALEDARKAQDAAKEQQQKQADATGKTAEPSFFDSSFFDSFESVLGAAQQSQTTPPPVQQPPTPPKIEEPPKLPESQTIGTATLTAQTVYLNGTIAGQPQPADPLVKFSQAEGTQDPQARLKAAQQALDNYIANWNREAEQERLASGLTAEQATAGGYQQAKLAREYADRIKADLASGALKTNIQGFTPEQVVSPLQALQKELDMAQKAASEAKAKDPASLYNLVSQIYGWLKENSTGGKVDNLVVVSSDPTGDAREVLDQLTRSRRNC